MTPLSHEEHLEVLACIHALYGCRSLEAFPAHALAAIGTLVPTTLAAFNEVNLVRGRTLMVMDRSLARQDDVVAAWDHHRDEHPLVRYVMQTGDGQAIKVSDFLSESEFHALAIYRTVYAPLGAEDQMSLTIRSDAGVIIAVALNRGRRDFSEADRVKLNLIRRHLLQAYANVEELAGHEAERTDLSTALRETGHGVLAIDDANRVVHATPGALDCLQRFFPDAAISDRLPPPVTDWLASDPHEPFTSWTGVERLILRHPRAGSRRLLLLSDERYRPLPEPLTPRELGVLGLLAEGASNAAIAAALGVTTGTVKVHAQRIFTKLGVDNRQPRRTSRARTVCSARAGEGVSGGLPATATYAVRNIARGRTLVGRVRPSLRPRSRSITSTARLCTLGGPTRESRLVAAARGSPYSARPLDHGGPVAGVGFRLGARRGRPEDGREMPGRSREGRRQVHREEARHAREVHGRCLQVHPDRG